MPEKTRKKTGRTQQEGAAEVRTLDKALQVLEAVSQFSGLSLSALSRHLQFSPSTTYRLLETLRKRGFVDRNSEGLWRVGATAYQVGVAFLNGQSLAYVAQPVLNMLAGQFDESVNLAILDNKQVLYVRQANSIQQSVSPLFTQVGTKAPLYCTGVGKVLLAWRKTENVLNILGSTSYPAHTPKTITTFSDLSRELQRIRSDGYAIDDEERELGVRCVAAPIRDGSGEVVAAISLSASVERMSDQYLARLVKNICDASYDISKRLGYSR